MNIEYCLLFVICHLIFIDSSIGQDCAIILNSENEFKISLNRKEQHPNFIKQLRINNLKANNKYFAEVTFKNDSTVKRTTLFLLDKGFLHFYKVSKKGLALKKIIPDASYTTAKEMKTIAFVENKVILPQKDTIKTDTLIKDTTYVVPYASYYHLEGYEGRVGCPFPIEEEKFTELKILMQNESLEDRKLEKIKTAILDMDSTCLLISQVSEFMMRFEYEETKLEFAKFASPYFFDIDNVGKLEEVFNFKNSMEELKEYIGTQIAKPTEN